MRIPELKQTADRLTSDEPVHLFHRALRTYGLLRDLRMLIDEVDNELIQLSQARDSALTQLGEAALEDLESDNPTLDRAAFAETLDVLRRDLENLSDAADIARSHYHETLVELEAETEVRRAEIARLDREIEALEETVRSLPEDMDDREPEMESLAVKMVALKNDLTEAERNLENHEADAERSLAKLRQTSETSQQAVDHVDGRVQTVIRDLGRSILRVDHELALSDPAVQVRESRVEMRRIRQERDQAIQMMEQVDTTPILICIGLLVLSTALILGLGFWLI